MRPGLALLTPEPSEDPKKQVQYLHRIYIDLGKQLQKIEEILNGRLTFGDFTGPDNVMGVWKLVSGAGAGAEFPVLHNLGVVPMGFILMVPPVAGVVNRGATVWNKTQLFLTCTVASQTFTIFVVPPPTTEL